VAKELKGQGADLIVAIGHLIFVEDMEIFQSGLVDVLLSGHDHYHIFFDNGKDVWIEAGEDAEKVGVLDVHMKYYMKRGKKRFSWETEMRYVDTKHIKEDTVIASKVKSYEDLLGKELDIEIGETLSELDSRKKTVRTEEAAIGNLIIDAMREGVRAEIGLTNGGGIRAKKIYDPGTKIIRRDILSELPFGNVVVKLELTGSQIWDALENGVSQVEQNSGRFPQVSGMSFTYNPKAKAGSRINSVKVGNSPLSKGRTYTIATNDFLAKGGDGYTVFKKGKVIIDASSAKLMASMVMDYIKSKENYSPKMKEE
jgi:5''-nucleotidase/2'',3''-cyclic phosphodiesterase and related esterases